MDIHLINLDRSVERYDQFRRDNAGVANFIRYSAVDGATVDPSRLISEQRLDPAALPQYTPGALGCALSHLALWERSIDTHETITLCEDDVVFNHGFSDAAGIALATLDPEWDLVVWAWNFDSYLTFNMLPGVSPCCAIFDQTGMIASIRTFQEQRIDFRLFRLLRSFGTPCYSISPKGAATLYRHCLPLRPMPVFFPGLNRAFENNGIDIMMNAAYPEIKAFVCFPPMVLVKNQHTMSTILPLPE